MSRLNLRLVLGFGLCLPIFTRATPSFAAEILKILAKTGSNAELCASEILQGVLKPGEAFTAPARLLADPNQVLLGSTNRVLVWDWQEQTMIFEKAVDRPVLALSNSMLSPSIGVNTPNDSQVLNLATGQVMNVAMPTNDLSPHIYLAAQSLEIHPDGTKLLAVFSPGSTAQMGLVDLLQKSMLPIDILPQNSPHTFLNARYMDHGKRLIVTMNSDADPKDMSATRGLVLDLGENPLVDAKVSYRFVLPRMQFMMGYAGIKTSPYGKFFSTTVITGPSDGPGTRTSRVNVYGLAPVNFQIPILKLQPLLTASSQQNLSGRLDDPPYIPALEFTRTESLLIGMRQGKVEVRNLKTPLVPDDYKVGEVTAIYEGGHGTSPVLCLAASHDSHYYASGAENGSIAIWLPEENRGYQIPGFGMPIIKLQFTHEAAPSLLVEMRENQKVPNVIPPKRFFEIALKPPG